MAGSAELQSLLSHLWTRGSHRLEQPEGDGGRSPSHRHLPGPSKTWLKKPADQEAMLWSFAATFHQQKLADVKKRSGASAFEDWDETAADIVYVLARVWLALADSAGWFILL